jgi:RNA polymerase sigma factor (sigma-70 family)
MDKRVNDLSTLSDAALAARATAEKDYETFIEITRRFKHRLYWHIMKSVHNTVYAEYLTDRTLDAAKKNLENGKYREKEKLINWLFKIAHNLHVDDERKKLNHRTVLIDEETDVADESEEAKMEEALLAKAKVYLIGRALHDCSHHESIAFILSYIKGKDWEQIGMRLHIKPESARKEAYRCRQHVREIFCHLDKILTKNIFKKVSQNLPLLRYIIKRGIDKIKNEKTSLAAKEERRKPGSSRVPEDKE